jgi:ribonuclease HI
MITGALSTTACDVADMHAELLPFHFLVDKFIHRATTRLAALPSTHPLSKAVASAKRRRTKRHTTPLMDLFYTFNVNPLTIAKARNPGRVLGKTTWAQVSIAESREAALAANFDDRSDIQVYTDRSCVDGRVGAAAVLIRGRMNNRKIRKFFLGPASSYGIYEAELVGMLLALELIRSSHHTHLASIVTNSQAALTTSQGHTNGCADYLVQAIATLTCRVKRKHPGIRISIWWIPSHSGVLGNKLADATAKAAAAGASSPRAKLPALLRHPLPISPSIIKSTFHKQLWDVALSAWHDSQLALGALQSLTPFSSPLVSAKLSRICQSTRSP